MSDFLNGIGFTKDLEHVDLTEEGYPIVRPGYVYIENKEYYIFASGQVKQLDVDGYVKDYNYVLGTPYFIVNSDTDVDNLEVGPSGIARVLDTSKNLITEAPTSGWLYNENTESYDFCSPSNAGKYLVFDVEEQFTISRESVENAFLIVSNLETGEPFNIENNPVLIAAGTAGRDVPFYAKVEDLKGSLLRDKLIDWYKIYSKPQGPAASGLPPSGLAPDEEILNGPYPGPYGQNLYDIRLKGGSVVTNDYGITRVNVIPGGNEDDLFVYFQHNGLKSNLIWIQKHIPISGIPDVFQLDNDDVYWASREAMTAVGLDAWNNMWYHTEDQYNTPQTGNPDYTTRGDWKTAFANYERPPMDVIEGVNEITGAYNGKDFANDYHGAWTDSKIKTEIQSKRCAIKGFWGQVVVLASDIATNPNLDANCQNKTEAGRYIIDPRVDLDPAPGAEEYLAYDDQWGRTGTWNEVKNKSGGGVDIQDDWAYVLYAPGYDGNDISWFESHPFYFRGFALPNTEEGSPDYMNQDYTIIDFVATAKLQEF